MKSLICAASGGQTKTARYTQFVNVDRLTDRVIAARDYNFEIADGDVSSKCTRVEEHGGELFYLEGDKLVRVRVGPNTGGRFTRPGPAGPSAPIEVDRPLAESRCQPFLAVNARPCPMTARS